MIFAALSVQDFIDKVGAYVGFAAAIGLALFALLLFAQARELKRLREWGAQTHDRIAELERRLAAALELARRASTSQRTMAPGAVAAQRPATARPAVAAKAGAPSPVIARTSSPTRLPLLPAAPARVAGAALGSATVLVPLPKHPPGSAAPAAVPVSALAPAPATSAPTSAPAVPPATPPAAPAAIPAAAAAAASTVAPAPSAPAPATVAAQSPAQPAAPAPTPPAPAPPAGTNGHSDTFPPVPPVRRTPGPGGAARPGVGRRVPPRGPARPAPGVRTARGRPAPAAPLRARSAPSATPHGAETPPHRLRRLLLVIGAVVVVAAVAGALLFTGGSEDGGRLPVTNGSTQQTTGSGTPTAAPAHDRVTVAVLNGTTTDGLASTVMATLTDDGFIRGPVTNASDQGRSVTVVSYFGGHEREAQEVATTLNVPADAVQPIDADTEAACAQGASCTVPVVVTVGADLQ